MYVNYTSIFKKKENYLYLQMKVKLLSRVQLFDLMQRVNPLEKTLMLGGIGGRRRRGRQRMRNPRDGDPGGLPSMGSHRVIHD